MAARVDRSVEADCRDAGTCRQTFELRRRAARKGDDRSLRRFGAHFATSAATARRTSARIPPAATRPPRIEDLHRFRPGRQLAHEISAEASTAGRSARRTSLAGDRRTGARAPDRACRARRSCSSRPSRARRKSRSARHRGRVGFHPVKRLEHRRELLPVGLVAELRRPAASSIGASRGPSPLRRRPLPERVRDDENVGEQDRRVEAEAADRLQASPRPPGRACSRSRERSRRGRAFRGIRADSAPPGA